MRPSEEAIRKISVKLQGHPVLEETRIKISTKLKGKFVGEKNPFYGKHHSEESKRRNGEAHRGRPSPNKGIPKTDEQKRKQSIALTGRKQTEKQKQWRRDHPVNYWKGKTIPAYAREKMSKRKFESWQDPIYVKKVMDGRHLNPNKSELKLLRLLEKLHPGEWKYTGDFSFSINGKCPDFVNCNGQKKIIEFNGTYWHQKDIPGEREKIFAAFGYDTLIIWDTEMKDMGKVERRINDFHKRGSECCQS